MPEDTRNWRLFIFLPPVTICESAPELRRHDLQIPRLGDFSWRSVRCLRRANFPVKNRNWSNVYYRENCLLEFLAV